MNHVRNARQHAAPSLPSIIVTGLVFAGLILLERARPLRKSVEPKLRRNVRNLAIAGLGAVAARLAEAPLVVPLAAAVERRRWGLLKIVPLPLWFEVAAGCILLDYTLYLWHVLTHKVPALWRFHQVHHVDLDLDASTALRFHFGELALSAPWRAMQVLLIGICPLTLSLWQTALLIEILFHHSNVQLPIRVERFLSRLIVTPRLHGIHHSAIEEEADSNWSSGLTIWDRLHGTFRQNVPQNAIIIGVPAFREPSELTLPRAIELPFTEQRASFPLPEDRIRPKIAGSQDELLP